MKGLFLRYVTRIFQQFINLIMSNKSSVKRIINVALKFVCNLLEKF